MLEIGCGTGYILFYCAWRFPDCAEFTGIDLQPEKIEEAEKQLRLFQTLIPEKHAAIRLQTGNIEEVPTPEKPYDLLMCNPPFFVAHASRPSPNPARRLARQDATLSPDRLFKQASRLLVLQGRMVLVYPQKRMQEVERAADRYGFVLIEQSQRADIRGRSGGIVLMTAKKTESS